MGTKYERRMMTTFHDHGYIYILWPSPAWRLDCLLPSAVVFGRSSWVLV
jgi:hypothetical protein